MQELRVNPFDFARIQHEASRLFPLEIFKGDELHGFLYTTEEERFADFMERHFGCRRFESCRVILDVTRPALFATFGEDS